MNTLELDLAAYNTETYPGESFESLSVADLEWLNKLGATPLDDDQLDSINQLIDAGSKDLRNDTDPKTIQSVMRARQEFFGQILGWDDNSHPLHGTYQSYQNDRPTIMPLHTFIGTQRTMHQLGLDASKVINALPSVLGLKKESIREKVANLTELELDAAKVVNVHPAVLGYKKESVRDKMANLTELELDAAKVVNVHPVVLGLKKESVRDKMANLTELELDAAKVVNVHPVVLGYKKESVREKMANLTELELDAARVVTALPTALGLSQEKIRLTCYALMKANLWEASDEFEGYRALLNRGEKLDIFTVPLETLLIHFADEALHTRINDRSMRRYLTNRGIATATERKAVTKELLGNTDARDKLGYLAVLYALKEKIEIAY